MYRKPSGSVGFSWGRLITNAEPNFANDSANDVDLSPKQQDDLFKWQLNLEDPKVFNDVTLFIAGIVENKSQSGPLLASLKKCGVASPTDGSIHTELITKHFPHQVPQISIHRQRKLIGLLFFWEEELVRWRLLDEEEADIRQAMEMYGEEHEHLKVALGKVWAKRVMLPSTRAQTQESVEEHPPSYGDRKKSVGIIDVAR